MNNQDAKAKISTYEPVPELITWELIGAMETVTIFFKSLLANCIDQSSNGTSLRNLAMLDRSDLKVPHPSSFPAPKKLLLGYKEASDLLSMTEQALRDLVHKGQGPETIKRGKRVCFTHEGLERYVAKLPREHPRHGIIEAMTTIGCKPISIEEKRAFK